jgi:hypothetical protein
LEVRRPSIIEPGEVHLRFTGGGRRGRNGIEVPLPGKVSWRSHYFAGGRRIAMREVNALGYPFGTVTWLLGDHLGSTSVTVDENGQALAARQYDPCPPRGRFAREVYVNLHAIMIHRITPKV